MRTECSCDKVMRRFVADCKQIVYIYIYNPDFKSKVTPFNEMLCYGEAQKTCQNVGKVEANKVGGEQTASIL